MTSTPSAATANTTYFQACHQLDALAEAWGPSGATEAKLTVRLTGSLDHYQVNDLVERIRSRYKEHHWRLDFGYVPPKTGGLLEVKPALKIRVVRRY